MTEQTASASDASVQAAKPEAPALPVLPDAAMLERVERLLLRAQELKKANAILQQELGIAQAERDSLKSRLAAARQRVDALLERIPDAMLDTNAETL